MDRRVFLGGSLILLMTPFAVEAQQAGKMYRIGVIGWSPGSLYEGQGYLKAFREELQRLGWVEGRNLRLEYRFAEGKADRLLPLLAELDGLALDLIVTITTTVTKAAAQAIKMTPIVFVVVADPVQSGIVSSLARPGGNATGPAALAGSEVAEKWLELLKEAVPKISRLAVLWEPTNPGVALTFQRMRDAAPMFGLMLQSLELRRPHDLPEAFAAMATQHPHALVALTTPLTVRYRDQIIEFASKNKLPSMGLDFPRAGGLLSYGEVLSDNFPRAAVYVDKILRGADPAELPVELPTKFELVINLKTAKAIGLSIPPSLLLRADQVIE